MLRRRASSTATWAFSESATNPRFPCISKSPAYLASRNIIIVSITSPTNAGIVRFFSTAKTKKEYEHDEFTSELEASPPFPYLSAAKRTTPPFRLPTKFVNKYESMDPPFGFNGLGELVYRRTYSRLKKDGTNEKW